MKFNIADILMFTTVLAFALSMAQGDWWRYDIPIVSRYWASLLYAVFVMGWSKSLEYKMSPVESRSVVIGARILATSFYAFFSYGVGIATSVAIVFPEETSIFVVPMGLFLYAISLIVFFEDTVIRNNSID